MRVQDTTIIVTGGGDGIGRCVVLELLRRGARVAAIDLRTDALATTAELAGAGDRLSTLDVDVTDRAATEALPERVVAALGPIDGVVNVAGVIQPFVDFVDLDIDRMERVVDVNFWGTVNVLKSVLPHLTARPEAHVVNVSSMGGFLPVPGQSVYGASKAAVSLLTEALQSELHGTGVGVTVVMPGGVATDIVSNSGVEMPGGVDASAGAAMTTPQEAARIIVDAIEKGRTRVHVGRDAKLMGALVRLSPAVAGRIIRRQLGKLVAGDDRPTVS